MTSNDNKHLEDPGGSQQFTRVKEEQNDTCSSDEVRTHVYLICILHFKWKHMIWVGQSIGRNS